MKPKIEPKMKPKIEPKIEPIIFDACSQFILNKISKNKNNNNIIQDLLDEFKQLDINIINYHKKIYRIYNSIRVWYSPLQNIINSDIVYIGINPGGDPFKEPDKYNEDNGCSAYNENWQLANNTRKLFNHLNINIIDVLGFNIFPFRSKDEKDLQKLNFDKDYYVNRTVSMLKLSNRKVIFTCGNKKTGSPFELLCTKFKKTKCYGNMIYDINYIKESPFYNCGQLKYIKFERILLIGLPHQSRCYGEERSLKIKSIYNENIN
jgi:hypothetical protein